MAPVLAIHSVLGVLLVIAAIYLLVIAIIARDVPVIVTSAVGLAAIVTAAVMGFSFARNVATGNSMGWPRPRGRPGLLCHRAVRRASTRRNTIILAGSRATGQ
jgi:hypothetical protein